MKTKELLDLKIQVFNTVNDHKPNMIMTVRDALQYGKRYKGLIDKARQVVDDTAAYKDIKMRMTAWLPTALCQGNKADIKYVYPVLCIDIDGKDNPDMNIDNVKDQLIELPFIYYVGLSIGGRGVFALAYIDDPIYYQEHFDAIKDYIHTHTGLNIDAQCSNTNRLRYMSYDDDSRIKKDDDDIYPFTEIKFKNAVTTDETIQFSLFSKPKHDYPDLLDDDRFCFAVVDFCIDNLNYQTGGRTTGWMQDLSACKSLGHIGEELALRISRQSNGYVSDNDVLKTLNHKTTFSNRNGLTKFFRLCKEHFAAENKNWIFAIKELYELGD